MHNRTGSQRVADARDGLDARRGQVLRPCGELGVQGIIRKAGADNHQGPAGDARRGVRELAGQGDLAPLECRHAREGVQRDPRREQRTVNLRLLIAHDGPRRRMSGGSHVADAVSGPGQVLRKHAAHVVVVKVVDDDRPFDACAVGDVVGREDLGPLEFAHRNLQRRVQQACPA